MTRVLVISGDTIDENMGGVGIRYWELAHALGNTCEVTLAIPNENRLSSEHVHLVVYKLEGGNLQDLVKNQDVIVVHGFILHFHPYLRDLGIPLAVDLYVPFLLESLVWHDQDEWDTWIPAYEEYLRVQLELLRAGDFFFCASESQRDYWLGWLHAQKRVNPHTYRQDPSLRALIDVIPFGLPYERPKKTGSALRGEHPRISDGDKIILWSGGLWDWLDPLTPIRAVAELTPDHPELKLFFMGTTHPNPVVKGMTMADQAIALSRELGLYEKQVFFGNWVPYEDRVNYLLEANLGVISHPGHIETHFSFRTRVLDCIWTELPLVATAGDVMADWVESYQLGLTVPAGNVGEMAAAINNMLFGGQANRFSPKYKELRDRLRWDRVVKPLEKFCQKPSPAPDKGEYLTEVERIARDKDAYLEQVVKDKDAFTEQVIKDKNAFLEQVIRDKDMVIQQQKTQIESYQKLLPIRVYQWLKQQLRLS